MKYIITIFTFILSFNLGSAQGISFFHGTWQEALDKANEEHKLIFVDAYTKWCGPCKKMSKNIFTLKEVGDYFNSHFINVKMDMEAPESMYFIGKYPVRAYPTLFFIAGDGKVATKTVGGKNKAMLLEFGKKGMLLGNKSEEYTKSYEEGQRDFEFMLKYIKELNAGEKPSLKIANTYINSKPDITKEQLNKFVFESMINVDSRIYDLYIEHKKQIINVEGIDSYEDRIVKACKKTLDKAIEYESEELMKIAIKACKKEAKSQYSEFKYTEEKRYYKSVMDEKNYVASVKPYYKNVAKSDSKKLMSLIEELMTNFKDNKKIPNLINKYVVQLVKIDRTIDTYVFAGQYYYKQSDNKNAIKYLELALEIAKADHKPTKRLELLIRSCKKG